MHPLTYVVGMSKKNLDGDEDAKSGLKPNEAALHLLDRIPDPGPNESVMEYWRRLGPLATQATMIRALHGDHQASATLFKMVEAPVVSEVQLSQITDGAGGQMRSITAQMAMLTDINSGKGSVTRRRK